MSRFNLWGRLLFDGGGIVNAGERVKNMFYKNI